MSIEQRHVSAPSGESERKIYHWLWPDTDRYTLFFGCKYDRWHDDVHTQSET